MRSFDVMRTASSRLSACLVVAVAASCGRDQPSVSAIDVPSEWIRYESSGPDSGRLEAAWLVMTREDGVELALASALHLADAAFYEELERRFAEADAVLYEIIKGEDDDVSMAASADNPLSFLQRGLCRSLGLTFQLDAIDYGRPNFVHADLTVDQFARLWEQRGESIWKMMLRAMAASQGATGPLTPKALFDAVRSTNRKQQLKLLFAQQFAELEGALAGWSAPGADGRDSSLLIGERNRAALEAFERCAADGRRRMILFYGAAHMPDFAVRLVEDHGFEARRLEWITAWDVGS